MARSNRNKKSERRDPLRIANSQLPLTPLPKSKLLQYEDRRRWHPEGKYANPRSFSRSKSRLYVGSPVASAKPNVGYVQSLWRSVPFKIGFAAPSQVVMCVRRKVRKEVLHARRKTGRVGQRRPRWNWWSKVSCRRRK